jgi:hypothetical protein
MYCCLRDGRDGGNGVTPSSLLLACFAKGRVQYYVLIAENIYIYQVPTSNCQGTVNSGVCRLGLLTTQLRSTAISSLIQLVSTTKKKQRKGAIQR